MNNLKCTLLKKEGAQKNVNSLTNGFFVNLQHNLPVKNVELPAKKLLQYLQYLLKVFLEFQTQSNL